MNRFYSKNIENAAVSLDTQCFRIYSNISKESPLETQSFRIYSRIKEEVYRNAMMNPQVSHPDIDIENHNDTDEFDQAHDNFDDNDPRKELAQKKESKDTNEQSHFSTKEADNEHHYNTTVEHDDQAKEAKPHNVDCHHEKDEHDSQAEYQKNEEHSQVTEPNKEPKPYGVGYHYETNEHYSQSRRQENDECYQVIKSDKELKPKEPKRSYDERQENEEPYQVTPHDGKESEHYDQSYPRYDADDKDKIIEYTKNEEHHRVTKPDNKSGSYDQDEHYKTLERQEIDERHQTKEHRDEWDRHETDYRYNTDDHYKAMGHYDLEKRYEAKPSSYTDERLFSSQNHYEIEESSDEPPLDISMMKPGERLRRAREQKKLSVQHVADRLYLDAGIINALEADNYDNLPPAIFIRGYLRNYARLMEISPESIIESYGLVGQPPTPASPSITPQFKQKKQASSRDFVFKMVTVVIVVILMFLMALAWRYYPSTNQEFQTAIDISENDVDASSLKAFHNAMEVNEIDTPAADETITNTPEPKINNLETTAEPAASEPNPPTPEQTETPAPPTDNSHTVRIHFIERAWMRVTDNNDKKLYEGIGSVGKVLPLKGLPPFHLKVGNVDGVKVEYQGETNDIRVYPRQKKGQNYFIIGSDE